MSIKILNGAEFNELITIFEKQRIQERERLKKYGKIKPIIHARQKDLKFVAVGNQVHYSKNWKTFPDFLFEYVFRVFGKEWCVRERDKKHEDKHEVFKWYEKSCELSSKQKANKDGLIIANPNGITSAYLLLSYDLYTILNNGIKIDNLVERLKDKIQFQGARYELFCLAACIRAGFIIELDNEKDLSIKHVEFHIHEANNSLKVAVEAKSKHRSGILGQPGVKISDEEIKVGKLTQLINNAVSKNYKYPLIIFLEFNLPCEYADYLIGGKSHKKIFQILESVKKSNDGKDLFNLIILTNHPYHYGKDEEPAPDKIHSLVYSLNPRHVIQNKDLFNRLVYASLQFGTIPNNFDDV
jgi:hypothetical protein